MRELSSITVIITIIIIITSSPSHPTSVPPILNTSLPFWFKSPRIPCVKEKPYLEFTRRSKLACSVKCFNDMRFDCLRINYWKDNKTCQLFVSKWKYAEDDVGACYSYRNYGCPHSFTYFQLLNKCFKLDLELYNWTESKAFCNLNHPESHPITMETVAKYKLIRYYARLINDTPAVEFCITPHPIHEVMKLWTGGSIIRNPSTGVYSYFWEPFQGKIPFGEGPLLWGPTKPDHYLNSEFCIGTMTDLKLNDDKCPSKMCTMCEIDLIRVLI